MKYEALLRLGDPAQEILEVVRERSAPLLVIGLIGLHGLRPVAALGGVARRVLEDAPCPVLVVPHKPT